MRNLKITLLAATFVAGFAATQAQAQVVLAAPDTGDAALHGAGASSIQNVLVRSANCIGADRQLGASSSATALSTISAGNFAGTPALDCSSEANNIQPNSALEYVSTGSGFGRQIWREFADDFDGATAAGQTVSTGTFNPFGTTTRWPHVQFAFSDAPVGTSDLTSYNSHAAASAGKAISFPVFVLPVAIAFPTTYGTAANGASMVFNTQGRGIGGTTTLNLTKAVYCGIFNGTITNWNDSAIQALNGTKKLSLRDLTNDTATRWAADGAPIRLVGRLDGSGTTNVFTRHLAAVCNTSYGFTGTNKFAQAADYLPYDPATTIDLRAGLGSTHYFPTSSGFAGSTNAVSGDYWTGSAIVSTNTTYSSTPNGNVGTGLFLVANGSGRVASALAAAPDYLLHGVRLSGKVGYISADFVQPSVDAPGGLQAAALQVGNSTTITYAVPTIKAALTSFGGVLPPESTATGTYQAGDTRQVHALGVTGTQNATRDNPIAWTDVLYSGTATLADPQIAAGYPIVGTTQVFLYTCYTSANRQSLGNTLGLLLGQINKNSANVTISKGIFGATTPTAPGVVDQSNLGILPAAWTKAIASTFLSRGDYPGNAATSTSTNLFIQDALVSKPASGTPGSRSYRAQVDPAANPNCAGLTGA